MSNNRFFAVYRVGTSFGYVNKTKDIDERRDVYPIFLNGTVFIGLKDCKNPESFRKSMESIKKDDYILIMDGNRTIAIARAESDGTMEDKKLKSFLRENIKVDQDLCEYILGRSPIGMNVRFVAKIEDQRLDRRGRPRRIERVRNEGVLEALNEIIASLNIDSLAVKG